MANVIDALIVTLGLDTKGYVKGQKEAEKVNKDLAKSEKREGNQRREMESKEFRERRKRHEVYKHQANETVQQYRKIRNEMLGVLGIGASVGGMLMFAKSAITGAANLSVMGGNIGISPREIAGYQGAVRALGGSAGEASGALQRAAHELGQYSQGGAPTGMLSALMFYGKSLPNGRNTTVPELMRAVANTIREGYSHGANYGSETAARFGITSPAMIALMRRGGSGMQAMVNHQAAISGITGRTAAQAEKFRKAMVTLANTLQGVGRSLVLSLMPHLQRFEVKLRQLGDWVRSHGPQINEWLNKAADTVGGVAMDVNKIAKAMGGWKVVIGGLAGIKALTWLVPVAKAFASMSALAGGPLTAAVAAVVALLGALMYFYHTNAKFRHIADQLGSDAKNTIEAFIPGTKANKDLIGSASSSVKASWDAFENLVKLPPKNKVKSLNNGAPVTFVKGVPQIAQHIKAGAPRAQHTVNSSSSSVTMNGVTVHPSAEQMNFFQNAVKSIFGATPGVFDATWGEQ